MYKAKKIIGLRRDEQGVKIMKKSVLLRIKTISYLKDVIEDKSTKGTQKCVIKKKLFRSN